MGVATRAASGTATGAARGATRAARAMWPRGEAGPTAAAVECS